MEVGRVSEQVTEKWLQDFAIVYVSLHSSDPDSSDAKLSELSGNGYARLRMEMLPVSSRSVLNKTAAVFVGLPPSVITHLGLWDSPVGGVMLASMPLRVKTRAVSGSSLPVPEKTVAVSVA